MTRSNDESSHAIRRWLRDREDMLLILGIVLVLTFMAYSMFMQQFYGDVGWHVEHGPIILYIVWMVWFIKWAVSGGLPRSIR